MAKKNKNQITENLESNKIWDIVHIFGYGETQINGTIEKKVETNSLTKAQAVIDYVYSLKPADNNAVKEFHVITIINGLFARFVPKNIEQKHFSIEFKDLNTQSIEELVSELENLQ